MKISQKGPLYQPITITLETEEEATHFLKLVDRIENYTCNVDQKLEIEPAEAALLVHISNAFTNCDVYIR